MTYPDGGPEHLRDALARYDLAVDAAQGRVRKNHLPAMGYRELLGIDRDLGDAAERLCREVFGRDVADEEAQAAARWIGRAVGAPGGVVDAPMTRRARVALAVDLWIARHQ